MSHCDFGLIGLAVMGENLVLNIEQRGYRVAVHNRTKARTDEFLAGAAKGKRIEGFDSLREFVAAIKKPRRVMLMVKAGPAVDELIDQLVPILDPGDVIIDGGNTHYQETERRWRRVEKDRLLYVGTGVSGGEEGARHGPSLMPGGSEKAWPLIKDVFQKIAAKVGPNNDIPCCEWIGPGGAGHYVKMVHNGIEYGDMQLIGEAYFLLHQGLGMSNPELYDVFDRWNKGKLDSYLIEITRDILSVKDESTGGELVDAILDTAQQKGTGKWMSQLALDLGVPTTLITEAVFARCLSALKAERVEASKVLQGPKARLERQDQSSFIDQVESALYASKICSYAQGFAQLRAAAAEMKWDLKYGQIALLWRGGCIIRARFLERIRDAFEQDPALRNLLLAPYFVDATAAAQSGWRDVVARAAQAGVPIPAFSAALSYYDGYRQARLPANLLQAQRDYFGAHTFERIDQPGHFHAEWLQRRRTPRS